MKPSRLFLNILLFAAPFALASLIDAVVLPPDCFSFRAWEALIMKTQSWTGMPFYPNTVLRKTEVGDIAPHTRSAIKREVVWKTDANGFRRAPSAKKPEIVIVGDSEIAGSSLTQDETFCSVLEKMSGRAAYPYAPAYLGDFVHDRRFAGSPPKVVVFEVIERDIRSIARVQSKNGLKTRVQRGARAFTASHLLNNAFAVKAMVFGDRLLKQNLFWYLRSEIPRRIRSMLHLPESLRPGQIGKKRPGGTMVFLEGRTAGVSLTKNEITGAIAVLKSFRDHFARRNIGFLLLPVPNKETVHWQEVPGLVHRPANIDSLVAAARREGIAAVDLVAVYDSLLRTDGTALNFQLDDAHWNADGVKVAVRALLAEMERENLR